MPNPNEQKSSPTIGLSREDLLAIIAEIQKPRKTDAEVRAEKEREHDQKQMMKTLQEAERLRVERQENCSHMRPNGSTTAVYIPDLNSLYCQACAAWIRPNEKPQEFNRLYQLTV